MPKWVNRVGGFLGISNPQPPVNLNNRPANDPVRDLAQAVQDLQQQNAFLMQQMQQMQGNQPQPGFVQPQMPLGGSQRNYPGLRRRPATHVGSQGNSGRFFRSGSSSPQPASSQATATNQSSGTAAPTQVDPKISKGVKTAAYTIISGAALTYFAPTYVSTAPIVAEVVVGPILNKAGGLAISGVTGGANGIKAGIKWGINKTIDLFNWASSGTSGVKSTVGKVAGVAKDILIEAAPRSPTLYFDPSGVSAAAVLTAATIAVVKEGKNEDLNTAIEAVKSAPSRLGAYIWNALGRDSAPAVQSQAGSGNGNAAGAQQASAAPVEANASDPALQAAFAEFMRQWNPQQQQAAGASSSVLGAANGHQGSASEAAPRRRARRRMPQSSAVELAAASPVARSSTLVLANGQQGSSQVPGLVGRQEGPDDVVDMDDAGDVGVAK